MSGGKETPRQKMIGMMYLVLTALLALNVSSAVLEKFAIMNTTLVDLIKENTSINEAKLSAITSSTSDQAKVREAVEKAKQIRSLSKATIGTLDSIKTVLGQDHDGKPMVGDELVGNTNISEEKMLNDKSTLSKVYEGSLVKYHDRLQELSGMTFPKLNKRAVDFEELKNEKGEVEHGDKTFIEFSFEGTPTMAAIAGVTQMETEILEFEAMALDSMARIADAVNVKFDKVVPMVIGPSVVAAGAKYEGKLFMAGAASGVTPDMFRNGQQLSVITDAETSIKMAKIEFAASGEGLQSYNTEIRPGAGKPPITRKIEYTVIKPTIRITNGNAPSLYMNCGNFVNIEVPALGTSYNPTFTIKGGTIEKGDKPGKVTIIPSERKVAVTVANGGAVIGTEPFDVKLIPKPRYVPRDNTGKEIDLKNGIRGAGTSGIKIAADADENFKAEVPKDANFRIKSMEVILARGTARVQTITATSENIDLSAWKSQFRPGDRIIVDIKSVKRRTYTGQEENVDIVGGIITIPVQ
ncbi:MAG: gliding motility protein GldM [Cyclobacteriaceae bacterium]|jgi:gliding motility-associated protein GldM|nr:gliding motility protein GldM [Cytophagales bacterium]HNP76392.1 gliding motility protein GldM [Cyclobacteriaceae bacterium]